MGITELMGYGLVSRTLADVDNGEYQQKKKV
jgi:hypothetical protein